MYILVKRVQNFLANCCVVCFICRFHWSLGAVTLTFLLSLYLSSSYNVKKVCLIKSCDGLFLWKRIWDLGCFGLFGPPWCYQRPFCCGCTNQFQISWLFPIPSLLSSGKVIFHFFCNFYKKIAVKFFCAKKERFFDENGQKPFVSMM